MTPAPIMMNNQAKWNNKTGHFSFLNKRYLNIFPKKLITKKTLISSNHTNETNIGIDASVYITWDI